MMSVVGISGQLSTHVSVSGSGANGLIGNVARAVKYDLHLSVLWQDHIASMTSQQENGRCAGGNDPRRSSRRGVGRRGNNSLYDQLRRVIRHFSDARRSTEVDCHPRFTGTITMHAPLGIYDGVGTFIDLQPG